MRRIIATLTIILLITVTAHAVDMDVIKYIESRGDPSAIGKAGEVGLYQISPICLKSWNQFHSITYSREDLFNPDINRQIAYWYMNRRIPDLLKYYDIPVTEKNKIWAYNAGIKRVKNGVMPGATRSYLNQYYGVSSW